MTHPVKAPKKLIEVALPLDAINEAAAREKAIRHGHPSTLHLWWARRPLAAARAVIFAQMVNDPSWKWDMEHPEEIPPPHLKGCWANSRKRLFGIIKELVQWENTTNEAVLEKARAEIRKSWRETCELNKDHPQAADLFNPDKLPALHDPFAGGGSIPLEAQRLGLEAYASDLNPVAVLINKAMIEIPPKFAGRPPVNPDWQRLSPEEKSMREWRGAQGLADDVRHYGRWMRDEAQKRIGHLYPPIEVTAEMAKGRPDLKPLVGQKLTVIAWLWARTVKSPNPAFRHVDVPLLSTLVLSSKQGKSTYVEPVVGGDHYTFHVRIGEPPPKAKDGTVDRRGGFCLMSKSPIPFAYLRSEAKAGRMKSRLLAIVAEGRSGRVYLSPTTEIENTARRAEPEWKPSIPICHWPGRTNVVEYGMTKFADLFTPRQLVALTTFSDLVTEARKKISQDSVAAGMPGGRGLDEGRTGALAYAEAVAVYLAFAVDKMSDRHSTLGRWDPTPTASGIINTFSRQALPMTWDFAEGNPFSEASGNFEGGVGWIAKVIDKALPASGSAGAQQQDASSQHLIIRLLQHAPTGWG